MNSPGSYKLYCRSCREEITENAHFCSVCGAGQHARPQDHKTGEQTITAASNQSSDLSSSTATSLKLTHLSPSITIKKHRNGATIVFALLLMLFSAACGYFLSQWKTGHPGKAASNLPFTLPEVKVSDLTSDMLKWNEKRLAVSCTIVDASYDSRLWVAADSWEIYAKEIGNHYARMYGQGESRSFGATDHMFVSPMIANVGLKDKVKLVGIYDAHKNTLFLERVTLMQKSRS